MMPSGVTSNANMLSPIHGGEILDIMKSTSSINTLNSGIVGGDKKKNPKPEGTSEYVNIVTMPKSGNQTARKRAANKSDLKSPEIGTLSETHSPMASGIPALTSTTSAQQNKTGTSKFQSTSKPPQSATQPKKPTTSMKPKTGAGAATSKKP